MDPDCKWIQAANGSGLQMDPDCKWIRTVNRFKNLGSGPDVDVVIGKDSSIFVVIKSFY